MHWILQENLFDEQGFRDAIDVFERFNIPYSLHKVVPFIGELQPDINPEGRVICMGSYSMRRVAKQKGWYPGVFDLEPVNFNEQMKHWGSYMLNADAVVSRFADAKIITEKAFLRPIEDSKIFSGKIFTDQELRQWQHSILVIGDDYGTSMNGDTLIQVCPIKEIYAEYRYWIVDRKIATKSMYKRGGTVHYSSVVDTRFDNFVYSLCCCHSRDWQPHDAYVIDVCETPDGIKIVEINTLNAAGLYAANMTDLIMALEHKFSKREPRKDSDDNTLGIKCSQETDTGYFYCPRNPFTTVATQSEPIPPPSPELISTWIDGIKNNDPQKDNYIELLKKLPPF